AVDLQKPLQDLAVVDPDHEAADPDLAEDRVDDARDLGIVQRAQGAVADDVDVALVEFAEPAGLRPLAAPDLLDLVAAERKGELAEVLGDVAGQRHRQVEMERHFGRRILPFAGGEARQRVDLLLDDPLGRQDFLAFDRGGLDGREAEALELAADDPQQTLLYQLLLWQPFGKAADRLGLDDLLVGHGRKAAHRWMGAYRLGRLRRGRNLLHTS